MDEENRIQIELESTENEKRLTFWRLIVGIIKNPSCVLPQAVNKVSLLLPTLLMVGVTVFTSAIIGILNKDRLGSELREELSTYPDISVNIIEEIIKVVTSPTFLVISAVGVSVIAIINWLIRASILHLLIKKVLNGKGNFRQAYGIVAYAWIPILIYNILKMLFTIVVGNLQDFQLLGLTNIIISKLNPFNIWSFVLLIIGFSNIYNISKQKVSITVIIIWLLDVLVSSIQVI
jgi:hypothetical protein